MQTDCKLFLIALVQAGSDANEQMLRAMASLLDDEAYDQMLSDLSDDGILVYNDSGLWSVDWDAIVNNQPYTPLTADLIIETWTKINGRKPL